MPKARVYIRLNDSREIEVKIYKSGLELTLGPNPFSGYPFTKEDMNYVAAILGSRKYRPGDSCTREALEYAKASDIENAMMTLVDMKFKEPDEEFVRQAVARSSNV